MHALSTSSGLNSTKNKREQRNTTSHNKDVKDKLFGSLWKQWLRCNARGRLLPKCKGMHCKGTACIRMQWLWCNAMRCKGTTFFWMQGNVMHCKGTTFIWTQWLWCNVMQCKGTTVIWMQGNVMRCKGMTCTGCNGCGAMQCDVRGQLSSGCKVM